MDEKFSALEKYSFWDGREPELGFIREDYLRKVGKFTSQRLVKVLTGQRRAGKSYILRQIASRLISSGVSRDNIFFLNKEYIAFDFVVNYADLDGLYREYLKRRRPQGRVYIFIDEIQDIEGWEKFVNSYSQDYTIDCELFISGSNSKMLSAELSTLLTGRYVEFRIFPFSFEEYASCLGTALDRQAYVDYMRSGGLPELLRISGVEARTQYVDGVKNTIILKDIVQRHSVRDAVLLEDLFVYLVNNSSCLVSVQNIVNYLSSRGRKTTYDTVSQYIEYLSEAFLIHKIERYDLKGKEILSGNAKYYANDPAYHNLLYGGYGHGAGYMLENLVCLELLRKGYKAYVGTKNGREVDFVAELSDRRIYIQVAYMLVDEDVIKREYSPLQDIADNYEKIVVSIDDIALPSREGIRNIQAWNLAALL